MTYSSEFRRRARTTLGGHIFSPQWIYALLVSLISSLVLGASGYLVVLIFIISGPIQIGVIKYYIERTRRNIEHDNLGTALDGFNGDVAGNIVTGLLLTVFTVLWTLLFIIPGIVKSFAYSMTYYIKCDHPEYTATQAINESQRLMQGNKWRLFCLRLSFIGWIILGTLCFGVGILWVNAYINTAEAEFYQELILKDYIPPIVNEPGEEKENSNIF